MFILNQLDDSKTAYNMPLAVKINGEVQISRIEQAWKALIKRHESLRTSFVMLDGEPVQKIEQEAEFRLEYSELGDQSIQEKISRFIKPFQLEKAPLLRAELVKVDEAEHMMIVDMHHIISDGISIGILMKEFADCCEGKELPPVAVQYKDYSEWQKDIEQQSRLKKQEAYWLNTFRGDIPVLNMPLDFPRPKIRSFQGNRTVVELDQDTTKTEDDSRKKRRYNVHASFGRLHHSAVKIHRTRGYHCRLADRRKTACRFKRDNRNVCRHPCAEKPANGEHDI